MTDPAGVRGDGLRLKFSGAVIVSLRVAGTIPSVVVEAAAGRNGPGAGRLRSSGDGLALSWQAPGSETFGPESGIVDGGVYVLEDGEDASCWVRVLVYANFLTAGPAEARVFLADRFNELGPDDVDAADAAAGITQTEELSLTNDSANGVKNVKLWVDPAAPATLFVSSDGVTFYQPTSETDPNVLTWAAIGVGASVSVWIRRVIAAAADKNPGILNLLQWRWDGLN